MKKMLLILAIFYTAGCSTNKVAARLGHDLKVLGCPALIHWTAQEIGMDKISIRTWKANTLSNKIQPCDACAEFKTAAMVLQDMDGAYLAAFTQVMSESGLSTVQASANETISTAERIEGNIEAYNPHTLVREYLDSLATYANFLSSEMDFSKEEAIEFVSSKYFRPLLKYIETQNEIEIKALRAFN